MRNADPPRRARGPLLAGVVLAGLVVLALGAALGRASAPAPSGGTATEMAGTGPTDVVHGVPVGYARTPEGAVAAAANYTAVLGAKHNIDPAYGRDAYPVFALPDVVADLLRRSEDFGDTVRDAAALAADPALVLRAAPLGYRLDHYSHDQATVTVWAVAMGVGTQELPLATAWATEQLTLRWIDQDWKVADLVGGEGPEPPGVAVTATPVDLAAQINGFKPLAYSPWGRP